MTYLLKGIIVLVVFFFVLGDDTKCGPDWTIVGTNYCYRLGSVKISWFDADAECKKLDATLVRPYDQTVVSDIRTLVTGSTDTRWWTGLNDIVKAGDWIFDRGGLAVSADLSQINWIREPDDQNHQQNCGAINIQGSVSDERCGDKNRYICEYQLPAGGSCLQGWYNFSSGCYLFPAGLDDPWSLLTWNDAKKKCSTILQNTAASSQTAHLLYIETQDELNYIRQQMPLITLTSQLWWIGLSDSTTEGQFKWLDGSPINTNLVFWAQEPNNLGGYEKCTYTNSNGSLGDLNCTNQENYICMKENDINPNTLPGLGCPAAWTRAGHFCYLIETNTPRTWSDAQGSCQGSGASLIKMDSLDKKTWIQMQNDIFESGLWFWTGLNNLQSNQWHWTDGSNADMSLVQWNIEPNNYKGNEGCAVVMRSGGFNDVNCLIKAGFICELNSEDMPCPNGWVGRNVGDQTNCYYFSNTQATFDEAHAKCNQLSFPTTSYLMAFQGQDELNWTISQVQKLPVSNVTQWYTGLTDVGHEGFWSFDTTWNSPPPDAIIPWTKMPQFVKGNENCVAIIFGATYINTACSDKRAYICERPVYGLSSGAGSRVFLKKFSMSSPIIIGLYFIVYALCLHYMLHLTYIMIPTF